MVTLSFTSTKQKCRRECFSYPWQTHVSKTYDKPMIKLQTSTSDTQTLLFTKQRFTRNSIKSSSYINETCICRTHFLVPPSLDTLYQSNDSSSILLKSTKSWLLSFQNTSSFHRFAHTIRNRRAQQFSNGSNETNAMITVHVTQISLFLNGKIGRDVLHELGNFQLWKIQLS